MVLRGNLTLLARLGLTGRRLRVVHVPTQAALRTVHLVAVLDRFACHIITHWTRYITDPAARIVAAISSIHFPITPPA